MSVIFPFLEKLVDLLDVDHLAVVAVFRVVGRLCVAQTRSPVVQGKADGVEDGRLAAPGLSADKEDGGASQRFGREVDLCF